jgi:hypothetical protein
MELFPINSQQLLEVVANDFTAGNPATHQALVHAFEEPLAVPNNFTYYKSNYQILFCFQRVLISDTIEMTPRKKYRS